MTKDCSLRLLKTAFYFESSGLFSLSAAVIFSPKHHIENHHQHEADSETDGGEVGMGAL